MDEHFQNAPVAENLPMLLGLLGVWHRLDLRLSEPRNHSL
jgi:glucose-6-phosphate isomerase